MEGLFLPEGSGGEEPPARPGKNSDENGRSDVYQQRMYMFERLFDFPTSKSRKRRPFSDYTARNCEEAWAGR